MSAQSGDCVTQGPLEPRDRPTMERIRRPVVLLGNLHNRDSVIVTSGLSTVSRASAAGLRGPIAPFLLVIMMPCAVGVPVLLTFAAVAVAFTSGWRSAAAPNIQVCADRRPQLRVIEGGRRN
jgi:hypothetical protein